MLEHVESALSLLFAIESSREFCMEGKKYPRYRCRRCGGVAEVDYDSPEFGRLVHHGNGCGYTIEITLCAVAVAKPDGDAHEWAEEIWP